jgi:hypothetical protein
VRACRHSREAEMPMTDRVSRLARARVSARQPQPVLRIGRPSRLARARVSALAVEPGPRVRACRHITVGMFACCLVRM